MLVAMRRWRWCHVVLTPHFICTWWYSCHQLHCQQWLEKENSKLATESTRIQYTCRPNRTWTSCFNEKLNRSRLRVRSGNAAAVSIHAYTYPHTSPCRRQASRNDYTHCKMKDPWSPPPLRRPRQVESACVCLYVSVCVRVCLCVSVCACVCLPPLATLKPSQAPTGHLEVWKGAARNQRPECQSVMTCSTIILIVSVADNNNRWPRNMLASCPPCTVLSFSPGVRNQSQAPQIDAAIFTLC